MEKIINFERENDQWYAVLPDYPGPKSDLIMVMGADTMLDLFCQGEDKVTFLISDKAPDNIKIILDFEKEEYDGAWYEFFSPFILSLDKIWLCAVTKFVFGEYPQKLYIN